MELQYTVTDLKTSSLNNSAEKSGKVEEDVEITKSYSCRYPGCEKSFRYKSEILRHLVTHANSRPYVCPYKECRKGFKRSDALATHIRIHTRDKPFQCPSETCKCAFATKAGLRYHLSRHKAETRLAVEAADNAQFNIPVHDSSMYKMEANGDSSPSDSHLLEQNNTENNEGIKYPSALTCFQESEPEIKKRIHYNPQQQRYSPNAFANPSTQYHQQMSILSMNLKTACPIPTETKPSASKSLPLALQPIFRPSHNPSSFYDLNYNESPKVSLLRELDDSMVDNEIQPEPSIENSRFFGIINKILKENTSLRKNLEICQTVIRGYQHDNRKDPKLY